MKRRIFLLSLVLLLAPAALRAVDSETTAPGAATPGGRRAAGGRRNAGERLQEMKEKLGLTDEQTAKIKAVFEKNRGKLTGLKDLKPEERRAKMREAFKAEMEEIAPILTPEQKEKWKEELKKRRSERGGRGSGATPPKA